MKLLKEYTLEVKKSKFIGLAYEVNSVDEVKDILKTCMERAMVLKVPLKVEVEEGKWVPTSNKYNDIYKEFYLNLEEDGAEVIYSEASGFTLYVQNGELYKVEFTYSEKYKLNDATYEIKIEHEFVFSNIGSTDVAKPQM